jgi:hypothetical protein
MRQVKRWRYYCDHCRKAGGSKGHMLRHEVSCTANPQRECRICRLAGFTPKPLAELVDLCRSLSTWHCVGEDGPEYGSLPEDKLPTLREAAGGCPVCIFAAMRQSDCFTQREKFDLKAELASIWNEINEENLAREHGYGY